MTDCRCLYVYDPLSHTFTFAGLVIVPIRWEQWVQLYLLRYQPEAVWRWEVCLPVPPQEELQQAYARGELTPTLEAWIELTPHEWRPLRLLKEAEMR